MTQKTNQELTTELVVFHIDYDIWSGTAKLEKNDITLGDGGELPPEESCSLGRKSLIDPEALKPFRQRRNATEAFFLTIGAKFLNGYVVPKAFQQQCYDYLQKEDRDYPQLVDDFLNNLDEYVRLQMDKFPKIAKGLLDSLPEKQAIKRRFGFKWTPIAINYAADSDKDSANGGLNRAFDDLRDEIMDNIAKRVKTIISSLSTQTKGKVKQTRDVAPVKIIDRLEQLRTYANGLSMVDARLDDVVSQIDSIISYANANIVSGNLVQPYLGETIKSLAVLTSVESILAFISGNTNAHALKDSWTSVITPIVNVQPSQHASSPAPVLTVVEESPQSKFSDLDAFFASVA